jgi:HD-GYP domain-containing protein (c-di-GMP phosphodiesterase class II)
MASAANEAGPLHGLALGTGDEAVAATREQREDRLSGRDRLAVALLGVPFLAAALALVFVVPAGRTPWPGAELLVVAVYAFVARIEFEVGAGSYVPTQILLWPILFVVPLGEVPLVVCAGLVAAGLVDSVTGRQHPRRTLLNLISSWHAVGPVLVLWLAGTGAPAWSDWHIYALALCAQFACEAVACCGREWISHGASPRLVLPYLARSQAIDVVLSPVGLAFAIAAGGRPEIILLVLPLAVLLGVLSRERQARIDSALELFTAYRGTALLLGDVIEADDAYTGMHSRDVVELAVAVADRLGLGPEDRRDTELVALLHDVGKIRVPPEIVGKRGALTAEERAVIEQHTIEGERLLQQVGGLLARIGSLVRSCHERWDGAGYPDGLAGGEIPVVARVVVCCDAFSAMTTDRPYRAALSLEQALAELRAHAGTQFDPAVVDALVDVVRRDGLARPSSGGA